MRIETLRPKGGWQPFGSYEQYRELTGAVRSAAKAQGQKLLTNSFLMPARAQALIVAQRLFYQQSAGNLYELELAETYGLLSFAVTDEMSTEWLALPMPTKAVWPYRRARGANALEESSVRPEQSEQTQRAERVLMRLGFDAARCVGRMKVRPSDTKSRVLAGSAKNAAFGPASVSPAGVEEACEPNVEAIEVLLRESFHPALAELPSRQTLAQAIAAGQVFTAQQNERLAGVLVAGLEGQNVWIRQLVVAPAFRGQGLGSALVSAQFARFGTSARQFLLWVDRANTAAVGLYTRCGYAFDGHEAIEYLARARQS